MMESILDWNGRPIDIVRSIGGVKAVVNVSDNLLRSNVEPWPPPEIVQKAYSSDTSRSFSENTVAAATGHLRHYSALQSLHSEDAVTWSVFGPVIYAERDIQATFARDLCDAIGVDAHVYDRAQWWLWRRIPHPDKPVSGGPEIDVGLAFGDVLLFGEAKWRSELGRGQGISRSKDQVTLRREWCQVLGPRLYQSVRKFVILGISRVGDMLAERARECANSSTLYRDITWDALASIPSHPAGEELRRYIAWKGSHAKETLGERSSRERRTIAATQHKHSPYDSTREK